MLFGVVCLAEDDRPDWDDPWLTPIEIAKEISVNAATIRLWISKGMLPATRVGQRKLFVRRSDVMRLLAENSSAGGAQPYRRKHRVRRRDTTRRAKGGWSTNSLFVREERGPDELHAAAQALQEADLCGRRHSLQARTPPAPGFGDASAIRPGMRQQAKALEDGGACVRVRLEPRSLTLAKWCSPMSCAPGANRPGRLPLARFDSAVRRLGIAKEGTTMSVVASAMPRSRPSCPRSPTRSKPPSARAGARSARP